MQISIIIPAHNEENNLEELFGRTVEVLSAYKDSYEIIFVDDGSRDSTYEILKDIHLQDARVKIIKLSKNYGQLSALLAGFKFAEGEVIITMDGDLQNDPQDILKFLEKIEEGFDVVSGWRWARKDPLARKLISNFANCLIGIKTGVRLHDYGCAFTAIRKELTDKLNDYGKDARFIKPLLMCLANSVAEVKVNHYSRKSGRSKYNLVKIIKSGLDFLFNFTLKPKMKNNLPYVIEEVTDD